jgi:hypothetical protein
MPARALLSAVIRGELFGADRFVTTAPTSQTALDSVSVAWASRIPLSNVTAGQAELFDDPRVAWAIDALAGVEGARCVELGPLEGGHSYMLDRAGARHVTAIEANRDAYLKCLVVKELFGLARCSFLCGDVIEYLSTTKDNFDICWCAGILYHMIAPVELLELISRRASRLYIWTHYYDADRLSDRDDKSRAFANAQTTTGHHDGFSYELHRCDYGAATRFRGFWGGTQPYSNWLTLKDLLGALEHFGWGEIRTQLDEDHPDGPAVDLVAVRA